MELMVVVTILGILSAVAIPAYINHVNRANQSDAIVALTTLQLEQETFYERNNYGHYAKTVGCLPSFATTSTCLAANGCAACAQTVYVTARGYTIGLTSGLATTVFLASAVKTYYKSGNVDRVTISATNAVPVVVNPSAIGFSFYKWLFK